MIKQSKIIIKHKISLQCIWLFSGNRKDIQLVKKKPQQHFLNKHHPMASRLTYSNTIVAG